MTRSRVTCLVVSLLLSACSASSTGASPSAEQGSPAASAGPSASASPSASVAIPAGVDAVLTVGPGPCAAAQADGTVWVTVALSGELAAIDPATDTVRSIDIGGDPCGIALAAGDLWIATVQGGEVLRFDLDSMEVVDRVPVGDQIWDLQADEDGVWVALRSKAVVVRIDPTDATIVARVPVGGLLSGLAITPDGVWVADELGDRVARIDPATDRIAVDRHLGSFAAQWFGADDDQLWVASSNDDRVLRIDGRTGKIVDRVHIEGVPLDLDVDGDTAWVPANGSGTLWTIDTATGVRTEGTAARSRDLRRPGSGGGCLGPGLLRG